jgi:hypothetical protein
MMLAPSHGARKEGTQEMILYTGMMRGYVGDDRFVPKMESGKLLKHYFRTFCDGHDKQANKQKNKRGDWNS